MNNLVEFGEIADFRNGLNFSKKSHGKGCLLIGVSDFKDNFTPKYESLNEINPSGVTKKEDYIKKGDLLFVRSNGNKALVGRSLYIEQNIEALYSGFCIRARLTSDLVDPLFLAYYSRTKHFKKSISHADGTNINNLNQGILSDVKLPLYSKKRQMSITNVLAALDKKIELNNKINTQLEAMAKLIYDYWFVQFDFPDANGKPYKSSGGEMVYNKELNREIPDGWLGTKVGAVLSSELGGTPSTKVKKYWTGNIPWLNSGEIANFPIIVAEEHITLNAIEDSATSLMPKNTCVLSITRHLRPSILAVDACANQSVVGIYESEKLTASYIYPYLKNEIPRLMTLRTGAQQPHINKGIVDASPIISPPDEILKRYYEKVDVIYKKINNCAFQNKELTNLRNWLLQMLMNGQVTIKDSSQ